MGRIPKLGRKWAALLAALVPTLAVTACLNMQPKVLGQQGKFAFDAFDTSGSSTFKFNFALLTTTRGTNTVYLQGSANSKSSLIGTCNLAGTACACTFLDSSGNTLGTTSSTQISYDEPGNYYRCTYTGSTATLASVVLKNNGGTVASDTLPVKNTLTLSDIIGTDLDVNRVRSVYRYQCEYNFLQKEGTTTQGFDCSNQGTLCDTGNFCLLKARFPFYLFADTYSTNFNQKISDKLYNGGGTDKICGLQLKQIDCVGTATDPWGNPVKKFGLFGQLTGPWQTSVQLPAAPDQPAASYGFAAKTSSVTGECPPGLEKQVFFTSTIITSDITPTHNFASNQVATEVSPPTTTPGAFEIQKWGQGNCDGKTCTLPISFAGDAKPNQAYSSSGQTTFCVIPASMLP